MTKINDPNEFVNHLNSTLDARLDIVHEALQTIATRIGDALAEKRDPTAEDAQQALGSVLTLANATLGSIIEMATYQAAIAHSVGKIADIMERDYKSEVSAQADIEADKMVAEKIKRSFIGNPTK